MLVIFCAHPIEPEAIEEGYEEETLVLDRLGIPWSLLNLDALLNERKLEKAVRAIPAYYSQVNSVYRGWMLKPKLPLFCTPRSCGSGKNARQSDRRLKPRCANCRSLSSPLSPI